jgi:hypothetical protein
MVLREGSVFIDWVIPGDVAAEAFQGLTELPIVVKSHSSALNQPVLGVGLVVSRLSAANPLLSQL